MMTLLESCERSTGHDVLQVVSTFGSPRTNNKGGIRAFSMITLLDLEAGSEVKRFAGHDFLEAVF